MPDDTQPGSSLVNYLHAEEIDELNRIVVMFLDYAEDQARRRRQIFLRDWQDKLDEFLRFNERNVLPNVGTVSRNDADAKAVKEYEQFAARRRSHIEAQAEADAMKQLESTAKRLEQRSRKDSGE